MHYAVWLDEIAYSFCNPYEWRIHFAPRSWVIADACPRYQPTEAAWKSVEHTARMDATGLIAACPQQAVRAPAINLKRQ